MLFLSAMLLLASTVYAQTTFTITATATPGGYIVPQGVAYVAYDEHSDIYVFNNHEGYHVQGVYVDGVFNAQAVYDGLYRFMNVKANHFIHVIFAPDNLTIVASASPGGTISPANAVTVPYGTDKLFFFAPNAGYELVRVLINGENDEFAVDAGQYLFTNVQENSSISAQFEKYMCNVTYNAVPGAILTPFELAPIEYGSNYKFTVDLQIGYTQSNVLVRIFADDANYLAYPDANGVYSIKIYAKETKIQIENVELNKYEIVARAFNGGTITPAGIFVVTHGEGKTFEITPNNGFTISDVIVNGLSVGTETSYTFNDIAGENTIEAYFAVAQGIDDIDASAIKVFSNQNVVTILNEKLIPIKQIEIFDMYGRVVWTGQATEITLDVATGIYGVRIITESNSTTTKVAITK